MQITESFTVPAHPATVWNVFEDIARVARCVPGVNSVDVLDRDRYRVIAAPCVTPHRRLRRGPRRRQSLV